jgi:lycopene elongase/hydratase (dihydrobisanhydrobacterioruberin-forming)
MQQSLSFRRLLSISRPRFWLYELGAFIVGCAAAYSLTHTAEISVSMSSIIVLCGAFVYFTFPANLLIYGINDIYDYETDIKNPKKTGYEDVLHPTQQSFVWKWIALTTIPFICGLIVYLLTHTQGPENASLMSILTSPIWWSGIAFIFFATFYSAFPIRAKIRPGFDAFFSAAHYIATAVFGYYLYMGTQVFDTGSAVLTSPEGFSLFSHSHISVGLYALAGICWAMAMHAYSAVPDIDADSGSGIDTIATSLGEKKTIVLCGLLYVISAAIVYSLNHSMRNILIACLVLPYVYMMIITYRATAITDISQKNTRIFTIYKTFPILNAIMGGIIFWLIILATF